MLDVAQILVTITGLTEHYRNSDLRPRELVSQLLSRARQAQAQNPVWLYLLSDSEIEPYLARLDGEEAKKLPLYGIPFAIKDNIDLAGVPTTSACPQFSYRPEHSAYVVDLLIAAGAIPLGKTNLDQFATGLVGVRSPYGACKNALNPQFIAGGSSSGSAVAVAERWVAFSLGTDTAGSGRVPAALNHLVGLKPTRGLLSNRGLVPACRSLDCISVFTHTVDDANWVFDIVAQFDQNDPFARINPYRNGPRYGVKATATCVLGVPSQNQLNFFDDQESETLFAEVVQTAKNAGMSIVEIDFQPFIDAAKLLYQGPWIAERYIATQALIQEHPDALLPVTRDIIAAGSKPTAVDAFNALYLLQAYRQQADAVLRGVDCILTPTIGTEYTIAEVEANPLQLNSNLGYYTNFMNLLDCAAIAIPCGFKRSGVGFGVTLFHHAFSDKSLMAYAQQLLSAVTKNSGKTGHPFFDKKLPVTATVDVVVCGAHMDGLALNWQLRERGARLIRSTSTSPNYRFYALKGGALPRPGLIRDQVSGRSIEVEVWRLPLDNFGSFVAEIPMPLGMGKVELIDGIWCTGFICEAYAVLGAEDITELGNWRTYLNNI